ncbi:hypothetical protein [Spirosoma oryzicola]|uniref:hypothetical protein n=1 Tax=Spirosoma oryzicola TaxID=2898794 RepID=UPI001E45B695|nr:hypothetical protein [Spirosoma oryzicola]UHG93208.1 hypothetical protein LQ777_09985 [Spirosoma oryzicola]
MNISINKAQSLSDKPYAMIAFEQWVIGVHKQAVYKANLWLWVISFKRTTPPSRL